jgi:hypothetical protein
MDADQAGIRARNRLPEILCPVAKQLRYVDMSKVRSREAA